MVNPDAVLRKTSEFVLIPSDQGVLVDGGLELELIAGPLAMSALPTILNLIDGSRSRSDLANLLPHISEDYLSEIVKSLVQWRIIEVENIEERSILNTTSFLKRVAPSVIGVGDINVSISTPLRIISANGHGGSVELLVRDLIRNGFHNVCTLHLEELLDVQVPETVAIVIDEHETVGRDDFYKKMRSSKRRWLRSIYSPSNGLIEIGPMFDPSIDMCLGCLSDKTVCERVPVLHPELDRQMWLALLASEITLQLVDGTLFRRGRAFTRYRLPNLTRSSHCWPRFETCIKTSCGGEQRHWQNVQSMTRTALRSSTPHFFEESIAAHQFNVPANAWVSDARRSFPASKLMLNCEHIALTQTAGNSEARMIDLLMERSHSFQKVLDVASLSTVLSSSLGIREVGTSLSSSRRWTPSSGNLGSVEAYVIANNVQGLQAGVYYYKADQHALAKIDRQREFAPLHVDDASLTTAGFDAAVILTGNYERLYRKYGAFAYKLLHLDAGVASSQLSMSIQAEGAIASSLQFWEAEAISEFVSLRRPNEIPVQIVCINDRRQVTPPNLERIKHIPRTAMSSRTCDGSSESPEMLVERLIAEEQPVRDRLPLRASTKQLSIFNSLWRHAIEFRSKSLSLTDVLKRRNSTRKFSASPILENDIRLFLQVALQCAVIRHTKVVVTVVVQRCNTLASGVYRYTPESDSLTMKSDADIANHLSELFVQPDLGDAPVVVLLCVSESELASLNEPTYQTQLVRVGFLGHRLWMAAVACFLDGLLVAGISSSAAFRLTELVEPGLICHLAFLCGHAQNDDV